MAELDKSKAVELLNRILEAELAGVVRYTHYSLLVFGFNRIPIVAWLREQAAESLTHAQQAGEMITPSGRVSVARHRAAARHTSDRRRHHPAGITRVRSASTRALQGALDRRGGQVGHARGVRSADGPGRRTACRRCRQDATCTGRGCRLSC